MIGTQYQLILLKLQLPTFLADTDTFRTGHTIIINCVIIIILGPRHIQPSTYTNVTAPR